MDIKGLISLAFGTLCFGMSEFVAMGLIPFVAADFSVGTATAGDLVSYYATGVAFGAIAMLFLHKYKLKNILLLLLAIYVIGNTLTIFAPTLWSLLAARFISGLPHGCYFGVGSIIASRLCPPGKNGGALSIMVSGMTIANIFGVPLGTSLAEHISFRAVFILNAVWGLISLFSCARWVRDTGRVAYPSFRGQFSFMKNRAPWLIIGATFTGNAGIFCMQSYISPLLTDLAGISLSLVPGVLIIVGISMVVSNFVSGRMSDRFTPGLVAFACQCAAVVFMLAIAVFGHISVIAIVLICLTSGMMFAMSLPEQVSILRVSPQGMMLATAMIQIAFNLGNALGAVAGGIPFRLELSIRLITVIGAFIAATGAVLLWFFLKEERMLPSLRADKS